MLSKRLRHRSSSLSILYWLAVCNASLTKQSNRIAKIPIALNRKIRGPGQLRLRCRHGLVICQEQPCCERISLVWR